MAIQIPIDSIRLPDEVEEQMVAPIAGMWSTSRIMLDGGGIQANQNWAHPLRRYEVRLGATPVETLETVRDLLVTRRGIRGFLLRDYSDFTAIDELIGTGDGNETDFPLIKTYADVTAPYSRPIFRPDASTIDVTVDGAPTTFTLQQGYIIRIAPAPGVGLEVRATFEFFVPVRLEEDEQMLQVIHAELHDLETFRLMEVREYAA